MVLVGHKDGPSDPSRNGGGAPTLLRSTISFASITTEGGKFQNGAMVDNSPLTPIVSGMTGAFVVNDNDFSTGPAVFTLGPYELTSFVDYTPGAGVNATATAVAAAISRLPGYIATANVATVSVERSGSCDEVEFSVKHFGTHTNFNALVPTTGYFQTGFPIIGAPVLAL